MPVFAVINSILAFIKVAPLVFAFRPKATLQTVLSRLRVVFSYKRRGTSNKTVLLSLKDKELVNNPKAYLTINCFIYNLIVF